MTVGELKKLLEPVDDDLLLVYNYDTGHSFKTFIRGYTDEVQPVLCAPGPLRRLCFVLDEN